MPMIEAVLVEVPNPRHPFGARGVGEVPIVPPMAAIGNAIRGATGLRMHDLPMSPPKVRAALDAAARPKAAECRRSSSRAPLASGSPVGKTELEVAATTFRRLVLELEERFPGLGKQVEESMAVAIDGEIFQDAYSAKFGPDSEIVLIPKIGGG